MGGRRLFVLLIVSCLSGASCLDKPEDETGPGGDAILSLHGPGWEQPGVHGASYLADPASCATGCHGLDLAGGFSNVSCRACHADFPHPEHFALPENHGPASRPAAARSRCGDCHGVDFLGGRSGVSCLGCHDSYPHGALWRDPPVHGRPVLEAGSPAGCATSCHGQDFRGGSSRVSCFSCHDTYPHGPFWALFDRHGAAARPSAAASCATRCHGQNFQGGETGISCYSCHGTYPHRDWSPFTTHWAWVREYGEGGCLSTQGCHDTMRGPEFQPLPGCTTFCHQAPQGGMP